MQEIVLGVGGLAGRRGARPRGRRSATSTKAMPPSPILERARRPMCGARAFPSGKRLWATRAGNVFTTHTPVAAGFDRFRAASASGRYCVATSTFAPEPGLKALDEILALGPGRSADAGEPFNMAYLALRGSGELRRQPAARRASAGGFSSALFPRWPELEVPVGHITNGVHIPTWDSPDADRIWTEACGKERWRGMPDALPALVSSRQRCAVG